MSRPWRVARSLLTLRAEVDKAFPHRDRASDGFIGDAEHATRDSDHNPFIVVDGVGVVRAGDTDAGPGINPDEAHDQVGDAVAEVARRAGKAGHPAMGRGAYVICESKIASALSGWEWRPYTGQNRHNSHTHVSVALARAGFDSTKPWGFAAYVHPPKPVRPPVPRPKPRPKALPVLRRGVHRPAYVRIVQRYLGLRPDGVFGPKTAAAVSRFKRRHHLPADGVVGPRVWAILRRDIRGL